MAPINRKIWGIWGIKAPAGALAAEKMQPNGLFRKPGGRPPAALTPDVVTLTKEPRGGEAPGPQAGLPAPPANPPSQQLKGCLTRVSSAAAVPCRSRRFSVVVESPWTHFQRAVTHGGSRVDAAEWEFVV